MERWHQVIMQKQHGPELQETEMNRVFMRRVTSTLDEHSIYDGLCENVSQGGKLTYWVLYMAEKHKMSFILVFHPPISGLCDKRLI